MKTNTNVFFFFFKYLVDSFYAEKLVAEARKKLNMQIHNQLDIYQQSVNQSDINQPSTSHEYVTLTLFDSAQSQMYNLLVSPADYNRAVNGMYFSMV